MMRHWRVVAVGTGIAFHLGAGLFPAGHVEAQQPVTGAAHSVDIPGKPPDQLVALMMPPHLSGNAPAGVNLGAYGGVPKLEDLAQVTPAHVSAEPARHHTKHHPKTRQRR